MRVSYVTPESARAAVLRELDKGPRTLTELAHWALSHTQYRKIAAAGALVDALTTDGLVTRGFEPVGHKRTLRVTYRRAQAQGGAP